MSNNSKWVISLKSDGVWDCNVEFETREEAFVYGKENFSKLYEEKFGKKFNPEEHKVFYIGQLKRFVPKVDSYTVLEQIVEDAYSEFGEVAEGYLQYVTFEQARQLEERLNEVLNKWIEETKNNPTFAEVTNIEEIKI